MKKSMLKRLLLAVCTLVLLLGMVTFASVKAEAKSKVKLNKKTVTIVPNKKGKYPKVQLKLKKAPSPAVKWSVNASKNDCTVSKKGVVKVKTAGEYVVTAKYSGRRYRCTVHALGITRPELIFNSVKIGKNVHNAPLYTDIFGVASQSEQKKIRIGNTNPKVCTVTRNPVDGVLVLYIEPKGKGTSLVTATYNGKTVYCKVTVKREEQYATPVVIW